MPEIIIVDPASPWSWAKGISVEVIRHFFILIYFRFRETSNRLSSVSSESRLKISVIIGCGVSIWLGLFFLGKYGFSWLAWQNPLVANMVEEFCFNAFFASLFIMLILSNVIISYSSLFNPLETGFLNTLPIDKRSIILAKECESFYLSSWSVLVLGLPIVLAYGNTHEVGFLFYLLTLSGMLMFVITAGAVGGTLSLFIASYIPRNKRAFLLVSLMLLLIVFLFYLFQVAGQYRGQGLRGFAWLTELPLRFKIINNPLLPNQWLSRIFFASALGNSTEALHALLPVFSTMLLTVALFHGCGVLLYEKGWDCIASQGSSGARQSKFFMFSMRQKGAKAADLLLAKDLLAFVRDSAQWAQFGILVGLLMIYIINIRSLGYDQYGGVWKAFIATMNLFSTLMILATQSTRFFFPLLSLEGNQFWVLGLMPVARSEILFAKFRFAFICNLLVAEGMIIISNVMLRTDVFLLLLQFLTAAVASGALAALAVGMGALFLEFSQQSPAKIVSGFGGTMTLILTSAYVFVVCILHGVSAFRWVKKLGRTSVTQLLAGGSAVLIVVFSVLCMVLALKLGSRALERREI